MAGWCEKGMQMLFAIVGSFGAFGLMAIAIGTDYWLYSKARICNSTNGTAEDEKKDRKDLGSLTHSGLWRVCCLEGLRRGRCQQINHFPEDTDYDHDSAEYILRIVRASSIFPILSAILLLMGGVCIASSRLYKSKRNIILGSGILFVAAGLSNIIGVIVYISANAGDPSTKRDEDKHFHYSYGWSFYFGGLSFLLAETVGVLVVHIYIERSKESRSRARSRSRSDLLDTPSQLALPAYRFRYGPRPGSGAVPSPPSSPSGPPSPRSSASSTSSSPSQPGGLPPPPLGLAHPPTAPGTPLAPSAPPDISMFTLTREQAKGHGEGLGPMGERGSVAPPPPPTFLQLHNCPGKGDGPGDGSNSGTLNRKTTPV